MATLHSAKRKITDFLQTEVWRLSKDELTRSKALFLRPLRIFLLTIKGYMRDDCALHASALTFYSLLSVVPVAAMAFGIAKGFGLEQRLEQQLYLRFAGQEEVLARIIGFARSLLENTKGGLIAGIGVALLFWSALKVLGHIEGTLNTIWKVSARTSIRKFTDFLAIMIISPLLVVLSSSVNVFITTQVKIIAGKVDLLNMASPLILPMLKLLPFALIWLLFIMVYMVMPNTHVRLRSALVAGMISGTIYQLTQGAYIHAQVVVSKYNAIYGSFAALPLFLIWLQISWMIVLLGAEIAYAHQHVSHHTIMADHQQSNVYFRRRYAIYILHLIVQRFKDGEAPHTVAQIAEALKLPQMLVAQLVGHLHESGLISAVQDKRPNGPAFQPARDIQTLTIASVLDALDKRGHRDLSTQNSSAFEALSQAVDAVRSEMDRSPANRLIKDL
jgi:membrane protein